MRAAAKLAPAPVLSCVGGVQQQCLSVASSGDAAAAAAAAGSAVSCSPHQSNQAAQQLLVGGKGGRPAAVHGARMYSARPSKRSHHPRAGPLSIVALAVLQALPPAAAQQLQQGTMALEAAVVLLEAVLPSLLDALPALQSQEPGFQEGINALLQPLLALRLKDPVMVSLVSERAAAQPRCHGSDAWLARHVQEEHCT